MPKRISKLVREEAAMLCAICASDVEPTSMMDAQISITGSHEVTEAVRLACDAWCFAFDNVVGQYKSQELDAEAEALLRCGWSPEDGGNNG